MSKTFRFHRQWFFPVTTTECQIQLQEELADLFKNTTNDIFRKGLISKEPELFKLPKTRILTATSTSTKFSLNNTRHASFSEQRKQACMNIIFLAQALFAGSKKLVKINFSCERCAAKTCNFNRNWFGSVIAADSSTNARSQKVNISVYFVKTHKNAPK